MAAKIAKKCELQLAYSIGEANPVSVYVNTFGTGQIDDEKITTIIKDNFPLKPKEIIDHLNLKRPIYFNTASYGHFGRENESGFPWEKCDKVSELKKYIN